MKRNAYSICSLVLTLAGLSGCSSQQPATKKAAAPRDKIQGMVQINLSETSAADAALNGGGPSAYILDGLHRYRLFFNKAITLEPGKEYIAEGVWAQKAIEEIGDPDQGRNGYPLDSSCERVVAMAWTGMAFDLAAAHAGVLRARVKRYPARPLFLVTRMTRVTDADKKKGAGDEEDIPEISVPAEKQRALLIEGAAVQPAPLWEPKGGTVSCDVIIGKEGKIVELATGKQLCEAVHWDEFRYQPPVQRGKPVKVKTAVEIKFEPRK